MILLLGATGYIGQAFAHELERRGKEFIAPTRKELDYTRFETFLMLLRDRRPEFVVNSAGYTGKHKGQGGQGLPGYDRLGPPGYPVDGPAAGLPGPQGYWPPDPYQERGWDGHDGR